MALPVRCSRFMPRRAEQATEILQRLEKRQRTADLISTLKPTASHSLVEQEAQNSRAFPITKLSIVGNCFFDILGPVL